MKLKISDEIIEAYPDLRIGIVVARDIINSGSNKSLEVIKKKVEQKIRKSYRTETLSDHPFIWAWRETYRGFGVKPKKHRPTCETLVRRILAGKNIPSINVTVDTYLAVEAEFFLPCGGYDLDIIRGDIYLRRSEGGEKFHPLGSSEVEQTNEHEIVYSDNEKILTRRWNYRDCNETKITTNTKNVALFIEAPKTAIPTKAVGDFIERLRSLLQRFCGGSVECYIVDVKERSEIDIL